MAKLSVYIIAFNEEDKIEAAIKSVTWADEIVVADSGSTDNTAAIARRYGARVVQIRFNGFGNLRNDAMAACSHEWIFSLDADERCTAAAKQEILSIVNDSKSLDAYYVPRRNYVMGKWIRHAGYYPDFRQPQVFRKGALRFLPDAVHERYEVIGKKGCGYLTSHISQVPYKNLEEILSKINRYSTLGAEKLGASGTSPGMFKALFHGGWAAFSVYVLKLGCLDGWPGVILSLSAFESTFYKYAKHYIAEKDLPAFFEE